MSHTPYNPVDPLPPSRLCALARGVPRDKTATPPKPQPPIRSGVATFLTAHHTPLYLGVLDKTPPLLSPLNSRDPTDRRVNRNEARSKERLLSTRRVFRVYEPKLQTRNTPNSTRDRFVAIGLKHRPAIGEAQPADEQAFRVVDQLGHPDVVRRHPRWAAPWRGRSPGTRRSETSRIPRPGRVPSGRNGCCSVGAAVSVSLCSSPCSVTRYVKAISMPRYRWPARSYEAPREQEPGLPVGELKHAAETDRPNRIRTSSSPSASASLNGVAVANSLVGRRFLPARYAEDRVRPREGLPGCCSPPTDGQRSSSDHRRRRPSSARPGPRARSPRPARPKSGARRPRASIRTS